LWRSLLTWPLSVPWSGSLPFCGLPIFRAPVEPIKLLLVDFPIFPLFPDDLSFAHSLPLEHIQGLLRSFDAFMKFFLSIPNFPLRFMHCNFERYSSQKKAAFCAPGPAGLLELNLHPVALTSFLSEPFVQDVVNPESIFSDGLARHSFYQFIAFILGFAVG